MTDPKRGEVWLVNLDPICIEPTQTNGLTKTSAADVLQLRSVDTKRFVRKVGTLSTADLQEIVFAIAAIVEYQEPSDEL